MSRWNNSKLASSGSSSSARLQLSADGRLVPVPSSSVAGSQGRLGSKSSFESLNVSAGRMSTLGRMSSGIPDASQREFDCAGALNKSLRTYSGPKLGKLAEEREVQGEEMVGYPMFLGPDGTVFDIEYRPVTLEVFHDEKELEDLPNAEYIREMYARATRRGEKARQAAAVLEQRQQRTKSEDTDNMTGYLVALAHGCEQLDADFPRFLEQNRFVHRPRLWACFPDTSDYNSFAEYEEALTQWYFLVKQSLGTLELPLPVGRFFYRPPVQLSARLYSTSHNSEDLHTSSTVPTLAGSSDAIAIKDSEDGSRSNTSSIIITSSSSPPASSGMSPSMPNSNGPQIQISQSLSQSAPAIQLSTAFAAAQSGGGGGAESSDGSPKIDPAAAPNAASRHSLGPAFQREHADSDELFNAIISRRRAKTVSSKARDPWEAALYPAEPEPCMYPNIDLYLEAMTNWACACAQITRIPPHAIQMSTLNNLVIRKPPFFIKAYHEKRVALAGSGGKGAAGAAGGKNDVADSGSILARIAALPPCDLKKETREMLIEKLETCSRFREKKLESRKWYGPTLYPVIHGQLPRTKGVPKPLSKSKSATSLMDEFALGSLPTGATSRSNSLMSTASAPGGSSGGGEHVPASMPLGHNSSSGNLLAQAVTASAASKAQQQQSSSPSVHAKFATVSTPQRAGAGGTGSSSEIMMHSPLPAGMVVTKTVRIQNEGLRRLDWDEATRRKCLDCEPVINDVAVEFKIPKCDIKIAEIKRLRNDPDYCAKRRADYLSLQWHGRLDKHHTWDHPLLDPAKLRKAFDDCREFIKFSLPIKVDVILQVFANDLFLDQFEELLGAYPDEMAPKSFLEELAAAFTPESAAEILSIFDHSSNELAHAKLAAFVCGAFTLNKVGSEVFEHLIDRQDFRSMERVARALLFFNHAPPSLFVFSLEAQFALRRVGHESLSQLVHNVLIRYYLASMLEAITPKEFLYLTLKSTLVQFDSLFKSEIKNAIENVDERLLVHVFRHCKSRSKPLSELMLFVISELLKTFSDSMRRVIAEMVKAAGPRRDKSSSRLLSGREDLGLDIDVPPNSLFDAIREVCDSRYSHVHSAATSLFRMITASQDLSMVMLSEYLNDSETVLYDLVGLPTSKVYVSTAESEPPLLTRLTAQFLCDMLARATTASQISAFVVTQLFHKLLKRVLACKTLSAGETQSVLGVARAAHVLSELARTYYRLNIFRSSDLTVIKTKKLEKLQNTSAQELNVEVQVADLLGLTTFQDTLERTGDKERWGVKADLMDALRQLVKIQGTLDMIKNERGFWDLLLTACRMHSEARYNKSAWKVFFNVCRSHPNAILEIHKQERVRPFIEIIAPLGAGINYNVLCNSLLYLAKLFELTRERPANFTKPPLPEAVKKTQAEGVTKIARIIEKHSLFIKLHMVYKNLDNREQLSGRASQLLARLYHDIMTVPEAKQLAKTLRKSPEYERSLLDLSGLVSREKIK